MKSKKKIKVLQIVPWYPDKNDKYNPSRGTFFQEQFTSLSEFVDLTVLVIDIQYIRTLDKYKNCWHIEKKDADTFKLYRIKAIEIPKCLECTVKYISWLLSNTHISEVIKSCDLIHAHVLFPSGAIGYELSKKFKKPFLLTEHASYLEKLLKNNYLQHVLINSEYVMAVSNFLKNKILTYGRIQCEVIPNYIDTKKYYFHKNSSQKSTILHISSMASIKNIDILLLGIKDFIEKNKIYIEVLLIGGGANINKYQVLSKKLNLQDLVRFIGDVSNEDLREYLSNGDVLIITSTKETFSVVGIEALASGIPVITTKCGGPEDYITESTGLFIDSISQSAIANSLEIFLKTKKQFNPNIIQEYCFQNFDTITVSKKIIAIYHYLLDREKEL